MKDKRTGSVKAVTLGDVEAAEAKSGVKSVSANAGGTTTKTIEPDPKEIKEIKKLEKQAKKLEKKKPDPSKKKLGVPTTKTLPR